MRLSDKQHEKLVLVCVNERSDGRVCCGRRGSMDLYEKLKAAIKAAYTNVRVSRSYCLDNCESGITVALMPENVYFGEVVETDIEEIVRRVGEGRVKEGGGVRD